MILLQILSDTLVVKMENYSGSQGSLTSSLITIIIGLVSAIIGAFVTIWYKSSEFKFQKLELENQKRLIDDTIKNNEDKLKAELIRIKQIKSEYELSLKKFDYEQFEKVLEFSKSNDDKTNLDKVEAVKFYNSFMIDLNKNFPPNTFFFDYTEYEDFVIDFFPKKFSFVVNKLNEYLKEYPHVFIKTNIKITQLKNKINDLEHDIDNLSGEDDFNYDEVLEQFSPQILALWDELPTILTELTNEFSELEEIKKDFIRTTFKK